MSYDKYGKSVGKSYEDRVKKSFDRAARYYSSNTTLQKKVAEKLCTKYVSPLNKHDRILDVGCGTGYTKRILGQQCDLYQVDISLEMCFEAAKQGRAGVINCDMNRMPFREETFDAVVASMALHWAADLRHAISSITSVLKKGGRFFFSMPVQGTLRELQICNKVVGRVLQHQFFDCGAVAEILKTLGMRVEYVECVTYKMRHKTFFDFLASIVRMGSSAWKNCSNGWDSINSACTVYNNLFSTDGGTFSSWNIAYFVTKK